jgi:hypothetical protein
MTEREALKLALEALEDWNGSFYDNCPDEELIASIQEILAQSEQEPVACGYDETTGNCTNNPCCYTTPPQRKPLTMEQLTDLFHADGADPFEFARAIERAHGIRGKHDHTQQ